MPTGVIILKLDFFNNLVTFQYFAPELTCLLVSLLLYGFLTAFQLIVYKVET